MLRRVPDSDLAASFVLWLFGSFLAGGLVGLAIGKLTRFEVGLGAGLLVPAVASLSFTAAFATAYLHFRDAPDRTDGRVVAVEMRPIAAGSGITSPVAILEYESKTGETQRVESRAASGLEVGETAVVLREPTGPHVGRPKELFGGALASLLFGTFPLSAAVFFFVSAAADASERRSPAPPRASAPPTAVTTVASVVMLAGLFVPGFLDLDVLHAVLVGFGVVAIGLWMHVAEGIARGRDVRWCVGIGVVAANFSVWSAALWWLAPATGGW
jgi:hypothetical protein